MKEETLQPIPHKHKGSYLNYTVNKYLLLKNVFNIFHSITPYTLSLCFSTDLLPRRNGHVIEELYCRANQTFFCILPYSFPHILQLFRKDVVVNQESHCPDILWTQEPVSSVTNMKPSLLNNSHLHYHAPPHSLFLDPEETEIIRGEVTNVPCIPHNLPKCPLVLPNFDETQQKECARPLVEPAVPSSPVSPTAWECYSSSSFYSQPLFNQIFSPGL